MDKFWFCLLILIFNTSIWINTVISERSCDHQCITDRNCNSTFIHNRCFYVFVDHLRSWHESRRHCQEQGLSMAKMDNELLRQNSYLSTLINDVPNNLKYHGTGNKAWLGGKAIKFPTWSYAHNSTRVYKWQLNLWQGLNISQQWTAKEWCGFLKPHGSYFSISIQDCDYNGYFLCRENDCNSACLKLVMERKPWFEARSHCIRLGGDLFYLKENEVLTSVLYGGSQIYSDISSIRDSLHVHIGIVHREWKWISPGTDGEGWSDGMRILDTNWAQGEPNIYDQGCLVMYGDSGKWDDNFCDRKLLTFCQEEIEMSTTTQTPTTSTTEQTESPTEVASGLITTLASNKTADSKDEGTALESNFIGMDPSTNRMIIIVIGVLLGVFFLLSIALILYLICRRRREKEAEIDDTEIIENNYYEGTVGRRVSDVVPGKPEITKNNINEIAGERAIVPEKPAGLPSYEDVHLYGNDITSSMPKNKPVIKPKPKIGPVNGDVYSQVDPVRSASPTSPNNNTTYINAN